MSEKNETNLSLEELEMAHIFSEDVLESIASVEESGFSDPNLYSVSLKNEKVLNGVYKSVIRFAKNPHVKLDDNGKPMPTKNILHKWVYFLPNPDNPESKIMVDCTSNWGQRDNIVTKAFFYLRNTKNPSLVKLAKDNFSRKGYWWSLVQVVKDIQQSELEGELKIFRFSKQVNEKIEDITKDDEATNQTAVNYSHPLTGRNFIIDCREEEFENKDTGEKTRMTSYSKSKFEDKETIMNVPNSTEKAGKTKEYMLEIARYLKNNAPDLSAYEPVKWSPELEEQIIESVRMVIEDDHVFNTIYRKMYGKPYAFNGIDKSVTDGSGSGLTVDANSMLAGSDVAEDVAEDALEIADPSATTAQTGYSQEDDLPEDLEA